MKEMVKNERGAALAETKFWSPGRIFYFPVLDAKRICMVGLLIAVTFVLSMISGYIRIGNISKLSVSFISVFIAAYAFGPIIGGIVGAAADIVSFAVNPVGAFIPQLTIIEFVYGFIYGILFFSRKQKMYVFNVALCDIIQFAVNMILKTAVLSSLYTAPFNAMFVSRLPMCILQAVLICVILIMIRPFIDVFLKKTGVQK